VLQLTFVHAQVHKLPNAITLKQGALAEPYSCVLRGWKQLGVLPSTDARVLVQGAGIIGCLFCTLLSHHGFVKVTVSEVQEQRRKLCAGVLFLGCTNAEPKFMSFRFAVRDVYACEQVLLCKCGKSSSLICSFVEDFCVSRLSRALTARYVLMELYQWICVLSIQGMGLGFDVVHPQELELELAAKDVDKDGFHLIIDCTGNTTAVQKVLNVEGVLIVLTAVINYVHVCKAIASNISTLASNLTGI